MNRKKAQLFLFGIIILGLLLRLYKINTNFIFGLDQGEDLFKAVSIYETIKSGDFKNLPLKGEAGTFFVDPASMYKNPVYTGVFYFYFILPAAVLSNFDPVGLTIFFALINAVGIILIYYASKEIDGEVTGLISALLFATLYWMNIFSRAIWTASPVPFFVLVCLVLLLYIKKGKTNLWPLYLFSNSLMTQVHDSGYFYFIVFIVLTFILRPKLPKSWTLWLSSTLLFFIPLLPTILAETSTGYKLGPGVLMSLSYQFGMAYGQVQSPLLFFIRFWFDASQKFWEFWASTINPWQYDTFLKDVYKFPGEATGWILTCLSVFSLSGFLFAKSPYRKMFGAFLALFFVIPVVSKIYYTIYIKGLIPGGPTFSLIGGMPFVLIIVAIFLSRLIKKSKSWQNLSLLFLASMVFVNVMTVVRNIWQNKDQIYDYSDKYKIVEAIGRDAGEKKYKLTFTDPYDNGYGLLYLFEYQKVRKPVSFSGKTEILTIMKSYQFSGENPEASYVITGQFGTDLVDSSWQEILATGRFKVYRKNLS